MPMDQVSVLQAFKEAVLLPFRYPTAFIRAIALLLLVTIACYWGIGTSAPEIDADGNAGGAMDSFKWSFNFSFAWWIGVLLLANILACISFTIGWSKLAYSGASGVQDCRWLNFRPRIGRFVLQSMAIMAILMVVMLIGLLLMIPVVALGALLSIQAFVEPIVETIFEFAFVWLLFQLSMALVSTLVDEEPKGLFDAWLTDDRVSLCCALALWLVSKVAILLSFGLLWAIGAIDLGHLLESLVNVDTVAREISDSGSPGWLSAFDAVVSVAVFAWTTGFVAVIYRQRSAMQEPSGETVTA